MDINKIKEGCKYLEEIESLRMEMTWLNKADKDDIEKLKVVYMGYAGEIILTTADIKAMIDIRKSRISELKKAIALL